MFARRLCTVLLMVLFAAPRTLGAQQLEETCSTAIPVNVDAGVFRHDMIALLRHSGTFRAQCERLARTPRVHVTIAATLNLSSRAQTVIRRLASGAISADVVLLFGENYRELLAHEFEHILEQLDGVDLRQEAAEGRAWLLSGGVFETRRAIETGVQVRREAEPQHAHAVAPPTR